MNNDYKQLEKKFLLNWVTANGIGWPLGFISAIILSNLIVNIFYHKETNLILGLCIGASVGYAQWFVLKRNFKISSLWGLVCTVSMGVPFIAIVVMDENNYEIPSFSGDYEFFGRLIFGLVMGLVIGLVQTQFLKPYFKKAAWWIPASSVGWGICFLASSAPMSLSIPGILLGGVLLGLITGYAIIRMNKSVN